MNVIPLIVALHNFFLLADSIEVKVFQSRQKDSDAITNFWKSVSLNHNTIKLSMHLRQDGVVRTMAPLYLEAQFNIQAQNYTLTSFYCDDKDLKEIVHSFVLENAPKQFNPAQESSDSSITKETLTYLSMADEVAKQAYLCASGDSYHPGYYTEIKLEETQIILKQINRTNARSINHKQDYFMRDLVFFIPTTSKDLTKHFEDETIGRMLVNFRDNSTTNNKTCGDRIREKLEEVSTNLK